MKERNEKRPARKKGIVPIAVLLTIGLVVNIACGIFYSAITPFMTANLNPLLTGQKQVTTGQSLTVEQAAEQSRAMAQELVQEGAVLLKDQNNALPLAEGTAVNLFGYGSVDPIYGGSGSGASDTSSNIDLVTGLTNAGFTVNQELVDFYKKSGVSRAAQKGFEGSNFTPAEVPAAQYTDTLLQNAKAFSDVAIVTFSRVGGEGGDLPQDMYAAGYSKTDDGRHYLELTQDEEDLLALIKAQGFGKVIVLINSSNAMELGFLEDDSIDAALWIGSLGSTGFNAVGEILSGNVNPSGRLSDTYAYDLTTAPAYWNAGDFTYSNLNHHYVEYAEGIYVGYRYYDKAGVPVRWPFGFGLSYTEFAYSDLTVEDDTVTVAVRNIGKCSGAEVVQLYLAAPQEGLHRPVRELKGFQKVHLQPGESETVRFSLTDRSFAVWQEGWKVPAGTYTVCIGGLTAEIKKSGDDLSIPAWQNGSWYAHCTGKPDPADWEKMLGHSYTPPVLKKGSFTMDNTVMEMKDYSLMMKIMFKAVESTVAKGFGGKKDYENPDFRMMMNASAGAPLRSMQISGGMKGGVLPGMLEMANGHFFRGIWKMIKG